MFFSRNKKNQVDSDFDMDSDLDFDDFDFPDPDVKDDRKPAIKIADGMVQGAVDKVRDTAFLTQTLKDALPDSYGESMDMASQAKESIKDLYDESAKEIKPAIKEGKRLIGKLIPKESKLVPKAVYETIERWKQEEADERSGGVLSREAQQEAMLSSQIGDIFKVQTEIAVEQAAKQEGKDRLQEGVALMRHNELADFVRAAATSVDKMEKYQSTITLGYQKKSLELQFRQLFMLQDTLQFSKEDAVKRDNILLAISKNTTLPEAVKITNSELSKTVAKNKFSETMYRSLFGGRDNMVENILTNVRKQVLEQVKGVAGGLRMGMDAGDQLKEQSDSMGMDAATEVGKMAGGTGVGWIGKKIGEGARDALEGGKFGEAGKKVLAFGQKQEYFKENLSQKVNTFRNKDHDDGTLWGTIKTFAQNFLPGSHPDTGVDVQSSKNITAQQVYTRRTEKTITEIIPGYLSRILREIQVLRTGNEKIELTQYDLDKSKFTSKTKLDAKLLPKTISQNSAKWTNRSLDDLLKQIDPTGQSLSKDAQQVLRKKLLASSAGNKEGNEDYLASDKNYREIDSKHKNEILPVMQKFFASLDQEKRNEFTRNYNGLAGSVSDPRSAIQEEINLGNIHELRKLGLVKKSSDQIDLDKVFDYILASKDTAKKPDRPRDRLRNPPGSDSTVPNGSGIPPNPRPDIGPSPRSNPGPRPTPSESNVNGNSGSSGDRNEGNGSSNNGDSSPSLDSSPNPPPGPRPRPSIREQIITAANDLRERLTQEITPESMENKGKSLRRKAKSASEKLKEQINNPESASNTLVNHAKKKAEAIKGRGKRFLERAKSVSERTKQRAADLANDANQHQTLAERIKQSTNPLASFFNGLTQNDSIEEVKEADATARSTPIDSLVSAPSASVLPTTAGLPSIGVAPNVRTGKNKSKAKAQEKAAAKAQKKAKQEKPALLTLTPIASAISLLPQASSIPTKTLTDQVPASAPEESIAPAEDTKVPPKKRGKVLGLLGDLGKILADSKLLAQQIKEKAKVAAQAVDAATGGTITPDKFIGPIASDKKTADGKEAHSESAEPISAKDKPSEIIEKLSKMGKKKFSELKSKPEVQAISEKVNGLKENLTESAKTVVGRSAKENIGAARGHISEIVEGVKSGKTKADVLDKAREIKDKVGTFINEKREGLSIASDAPNDDKETPVDKLKRLGKGVKLKLTEFGDKPEVKQISERAGKIKDSLTGTAKDIINRDPQENLNLALGHVTDMVNNIKSGKAKEEALKKIEKVKTEVIKPGVLNALQKLKLSSDTVTDIFVSGEETPRLTALKIEAGHYQDITTNKIVKAYTDIKGPVADITRNDAVVLEAKDIPNLTRIDPFHNALKKLDIRNFKLTDPKALLDKSIQMGKDKLLNYVTSSKDFPLDVYLEGGSDPILTGAKMLNGEYFDQQTGKPILHETDINGPVVDKEGTTLIAMEDIPNLRIWVRENKKFEKIKFIGSILGKIAKGLWHYQTKIAPKWALYNLKMLKKGAMAVGNFLFGKSQDSVKDVYVGGEKEPRLYAARIKAGDYRDFNTGERINHQDDIQGPIMDRDGTIVLPESDLTNLKVYDSLLKIFNPVRLGAKALKFLGRAAKDGAKAVGKGAWKLFKAGAAMSMKNLGILGKGLARLTQKAMDVFVRGETKPRLVGITMKEGGYFSQKTGKCILIPDDIDGPVVDAKGETVLTEDHIKLGLEDVAGKPFASKGLAAVGNFLKAVNKKLSIRAALKPKKGGLVSEKLIKDPMIPSADKTVTLLQTIKDDLKNYFAPKKGIVGDTDGDGDRDNSSEDKRKKREEEKNKKKDGFVGPKLPEKKEDKKDGILGMLLPAIGALIGKITGLTSMFGVLKNVLNLIPGMKTLGKVGRIAGAVANSTVGKAAIGLAGKGIGAIARGGAGLAVRALPMLSGLATSAAGAVSAIGASGAMAGVGTTLAAVGGGILTFLSSPVVLGVAATALAGYGAYKLYGYLKNKMTLIEKLRYVQYGFQKGDTQHASKIFDLEKYIKGFVTDGDNGPTVNEADIDIKKLMSPWGMDHTDEAQMTTFFKWYQERFKPVYLTHLAAIRAVTQKDDLTAAEKLKGPELKRWLDMAKFSDGPYHVKELPFVKPEFVASTSVDVRSVVDELIATLADDKKKGVTAAQLKAPSPKTADGTVATQKGDTPLAGLAPAPISKLDDKLPGSATAVTSLINSTMTDSEKRANAIDAVRFKAYGLTELEANKVAALKLLEREVNKGVTYDSKSAATWKGNPIALLENLAGSFGIGELYGKESNDWAIWFTDRFLVVYMAYLSAMRAYTGKPDNGTGADMLTSEQQLHLAKLLIGLKGIWSVRETPWPNFLLSNNSEITKENINLLDSVAKQTKMQEDKKSSSDKDAGKSLAPLEQPKEAFKPPVNPDKTLAENNAAPDTEVKANASSTGVAPASAGMSGAGAVAIAGGEMVDGRNAQAHLNFGKDVDLTHVNPALLKQFYGMAEEYGKLTGKKVGVNDGFRSYEDQVALKKKYGPRAAEPGNSLHEFGLALDVNSETLNEMDKMGLMRKYGFTRPVGGEPWHTEPAGIQSNISGFKQNVNSAIQAIESGVGRGGGGLGTVANAPQYARNRDLAMKLFNSSPGKPIDNEKETATAAVQPQAPATTPSQAVKTASTPAASTSWFGFGSKPQAPAAAPGAAGGGAGGAPTAMDGESKPAPTIFERVKSALGFGSSPSAVQSASNNMPSDPSVKVPEGKGSGFSALKDTIAAAAKMVGVDPSIMFKTAAVESGFNPSAKAGTSSASGLFQFTKGTWDEMIRKYGAKYGYTPGNISPMDPKAAAIMGAHYIKESIASLGKKVGGAIGATEAYIAHFLGAGGANQFLGAMKSNPQAPAAQAMPKAAAANKPIFYDGPRPRTFSEVYALLDQKVNKQAQAHGVPVEMTKASAVPVSAVGLPTAPQTPNMNAGSPKLPAAPTSTTSSPSIGGSSSPSMAATLTSQNNSPLTDAYGFKPMQAAVSLAPQGQNNQLGKELFASTENLLGQSVEIQKKMLEVMSNIFGVMSNKETPTPTDAPKTDSNTTKRYSDNYTVPKAPVSMGRARVTT